MAGKGGGAWKVAYADFVTAMMAFFLVMWITAQNKAMKESVAQYFENPLGQAMEARATSVHGILGASVDAPYTGDQAGPHGSSLRAAERPDKAKPGSRADAARPQLQIFERLDKTRSMGTIVLFDVDSIQLNKSGMEQLDELSIDLRGKPNKIEIRGHAVRGHKGVSEKYSTPWEVSFARSLAVMNYLISVGIEADRIRLSQDGIYEPYSEEGNATKDVRNARVEVVALGELAAKYREAINTRAGDFVPSDQAPPDPHLPPRTTKGHGEGTAQGHGGHGAASSHGGHGSSGGHGAPAKSGHDAPAAHGKSDGHGAPAKSGHGAPAAHGKTGGHAAAGGHGTPAKAAHGAPAKSGH